MKRAIKMLGGACCFLASLIFGFLALAYIAGGAGLQCFPLGISTGGVLLGLIHVAGFSAGVVVLFSLGACLCSEALIEKSTKAHDTDR